MASWEWVAAALGLINVGLLVLRSVWNYPFGLAMVALYFFVFLEQRLYSDMLLQIFFFVVQLYGWWKWVRARQEDGEVRVELMRSSERVTWLLVTALVSVLLGFAMARWTNAASPYVDASIAGMSITAQLLLAWRKLENWLLWILTDIVAIGLYLSKGLHPTAVLYAIFLILSVIGLVDWWRNLRAQGRPA